MSEMTNKKEEIRSKCLKTIESLCEKYANHDYMLQRLHNNIVNYIPRRLTYELKNHEKSMMRNDYLTNEQQLFIQVFLNKNKYYYLHSNNCFFEYNGKNYKIIKDDDIIHTLLSTISKERVLLEWKHKTKFNIIKQIKERNLFQSIPETETIQNVLNTLYPSLFETKNQVKYFLTIIGDNILKKNQNLIFLVNQKSKKIMNELDNISYLSIGVVNISNNFMTKYHENHSYENCRLMKMNENFSIDIWIDILKKIGLDLLCVSTHYSNCYKNSDHYLNVKSDEDLKYYSYYLKNNNQQDIIKKFCHQCLQVTTNPINLPKIEWRNIHFIWKQFLSEHHLPNMIYSNQLKFLLKELYEYHEESDSFIHITSKYLPIESDFIKFWEKTIQNVETNTLETNINLNNQCLLYELELDEICSLFKYWIKTENHEFLSSGNINEENVLKILLHFFPTTIVVKDKYVLNVSCSLWNKIQDIQESFIFMKNEITKINCLTLISFDDIYKYYSQFCNKNSYKFIVSKSYFEKYLLYQFQHHVVYDSFIETQWFLNQ